MADFSCSFSAKERSRLVPHRATIVSNTVPVRRGGGGVAPATVPRRAQPAEKSLSGQPGPLSIPVSALSRLKLVKYIFMKLQ